MKLAPRSFGLTIKENMAKNNEDSLAFKTFLFCPLPGLDVVAGAAVFAATAAAEACSDGIKSAVKDGVKEAVLDLQRGAIASGEAAVQRQLAPVVSGLDAIADAIGSFASTPSGAETSGKP